MATCTISRFSIVNVYSHMPQSDFSLESHDWQPCRSFESHDWQPIRFLPWVTWQTTNQISPLSHMTDNHAGLLSHMIDNQSDSPLSCMTDNHAGLLSHMTISESHTCVTDNQSDVPLWVTWQTTNQMSPFESHDSIQPDQFFPLSHMTDNLSNFYFWVTS